MEPVVAFHDKLMSSNDKIKSVLTVEFFGDVMAKCIPCTTRGNAPTKAIIRITPHEITDRTFVWNLVGTI